MKSRLLYFIFIAIAAVSTACNKMDFQGSEKNQIQNVEPILPIEPIEPVTCVGPKPADESQQLACPTGQTGNITQSRSYTCVDTTWTASSWSQVSNTCVDVPKTCSGSKPADETRSVACAPGQLGSITESRSFTCVETTWTASSWSQVSNNCAYPAPSQKSGECVQGASLSSCLSCPTFQPPKWHPSTKAEKLAYILFMSCPIPNKSDPAFTLPTLEKTLSLVQACTKDLYPETSNELNPFENSTIDKLLSETDDSMRRKFFKGLWYQPPYSDHFEAYFGLYHVEARQMFCYGDSNQVINGELLTSEWYKHCSADAWGSSCQAWLANKKDSKQFHRTQEIRKQLYDCIGKSIQLPPVQPWQPPKCDYRTFEGYFEAGGPQELANLSSQGYSFSVEYQNQCYKPGALLPSMKGQVRISGYHCK